MIIGLNLRWLLSVWIVGTILGAIAIIDGKKYIEIVSILDRSSALSCLLKVHSIVESSLYPDLLSFNFLLMHERGMNRSEWNQAFAHIFPSARFDTQVWSQPPSLAAMKLSGKNFATDTIFSRFYLPMIFSNLSRFIYLDNDVVVTADLRTLYSYRLMKTGFIPNRDPFLNLGKAISTAASTAGSKELRHNGSPQNSIVGYHYAAAL